MKKGKLVIRPAKSMINNIGFGEDGTHTLDTKNPYENLAHPKMSFPLRHPEKIEVDDEIHQWLIKWIGEFREAKKKPTTSDKMKNLLRNIPVVSSLLIFVWRLFKPLPDKNETV